MRRSTVLLAAGLLAVLFAALPCRAVKPDASAAAASYQQGLKHAKLGQDDQAAADFQRAIQLDPKRFEYVKALDDLLARRGQWDAIIAAWTRFIELQPDNAQAYRERGGAYSQKHDLAQAFSDAEKACSLGDQESCRIAAKLRQALPPPAPLPSPPPQYSSVKTVIAGLLIWIGFGGVVFLLFYLGYRRKKAAQAASPDGAEKPQLPYGWGKFGGWLSIALGAASGIAAVVTVVGTKPGRFLNTEAYEQFGFLVLAGIFLLLMGRGLLRKRTYGLVMFVLLGVWMLISIVINFILLFPGPVVKIGGSFFALVLVICLAYFVRRMREFH
jgi:Tetratricopeptide repeat